MFTNRLSQETSPYLLQHKENPVHWWAWGEEAFAAARRLDRPVLLSVGYAACHWCHVMAHESFEDQETADLMNANFINIKVDREERPDIDRIYMQALHDLGEQGGWPLTMFLTPDAHPFWGGTYFPKTSQYGRASFKHVLNEIARLWHSERGKIAQNAQALLASLAAQSRTAAQQNLTFDALGAAASAFLTACDLEHGGLKGAPKFPQAPFFNFLWTMARRSRDPGFERTVTTALTHMSQGGIYDHLGGGLARYSVDHLWLVPHFEKMLYDNAQFVSLLARVWIKTRSDLFRVRIEETIAFLFREMRTPDGAFAASYDADSEGEEGHYYVWSEEEIRSSLSGDQARTFIDTYDITKTGNWEGINILNRLGKLSLGSAQQEAALAKSRATLIEIRRRRPPPGFDDKVLADWNGLAISALSDAALALGRPEWTETAANAFAAVIDRLWHQDRLHHSWRDGKRRHYATADGYAALVAAALSLAATTPPRFHHYIDWAERLLAAMTAHHWNEEHGAFYFAAADAGMLIVRTVHGTDDVTPNANSVMVGNLARLHLITGKPQHLERAQRIHDAFAGSALSNPFGYASLLDNWAFLADPVQIAATGTLRDPFAPGPLRNALDAIGPDCVIQYPESTDALPQDHPAYAKAAAPGSRVYICRGQVCAAPASKKKELSAALELLHLA